MSGEFNVRRLRVEDAGPLVALRPEALETDPMAFGSSIADDRGLSLELVRTSLADHEEQAVFGCLEGDHLRGMVGVMRAFENEASAIPAAFGECMSPPGRGAGRRARPARRSHPAGSRMGTRPIAVGRHGDGPYRETPVRRGRVSIVGARATCASLEGALRRRVSPRFLTPANRRRRPASGRADAHRRNRPVPAESPLAGQVKWHDSLRYSSSDRRPRPKAGMSRSPRTDTTRWRRMASSPARWLTVWPPQSWLRITQSTRRDPVLLCYNGITAAAQFT